MSTEPEKTTEPETPKACLTARGIIRKLYCEQKPILPTLQEKFKAHLGECVNCSQYLMLVKEEWVVPSLSD